MENAISKLNKLSTCKINLAALTKETTPSSNPDQYFRKGYVELDRFHVPEVTKTEYEALIRTVKTTKELTKANLTFETASEYYIRKVRLIKVAKDFGIPPTRLDTKDYIWDERFYVNHSFMVNIDIVDNWYRDENHGDERYASSRTVYVNQDPKSKSLDVELWDSLWNFCYTAIRARKMLLLEKVENCISALLNIQEYTDGFAQNCTPVMVSTMKSYENFFKGLLKDKSYKAYIKKHNDFEVFNTESLRPYMVEAYAKALRAFGEVDWRVDRNYTLARDEDSVEDCEIVSEIYEELTPSVEIERLYE